MVFDALKGFDMKFWKYKTRRYRGHSCSDGFCGADDCHRCHPARADALMADYEIDEAKDEPDMTPDEMDDVADKYFERRERDV